MQVVKFATEAEAQTYADAQYTSHIATHNSEPYATQTTAWDIPRQRIDGDWTVVVCPDHTTEGQTVIDYDPADYSEEEEE
jgi:hypothetical protein